MDYKSQYYNILSLIFLGCIFTSSASYAQDVPPVTGDKAPEVAEVGIYVTNIFDLNFPGGYFKAAFWLWSKSKNKDYAIEKEIEVIGARDIKIDNPVIMVTSDGRYYRSVKITTTINQNWDIRAYPFDVQHIKIAVESTTSDVSLLKFVPDNKSSGYDPSIALVGWVFTNMEVETYPHAYKTDWGMGSVPESAYSRFTTTITLKRSSSRIFGTAFLGFFVADVLTGTTLIVESFASTRRAIPFIGRLNMVVGALFGAVGNKYLTTYHFHPGDLKAAKIDKPNFGRGLPISAQRRSFLKPRWNHDRQERTNLLKTQCSGSCCLS
ncbi:hypothetical protein TI04_09805, partial [Achromatium sp. WMS2]